MIDAVMPRALPASLAVALLLASAPARADDHERAETLFQEARALVEAGRYVEACPKLAESQTLDPAVGTQFNLADCYEHIGRTATAHALFGDVARIARAAGKFDRERSARERAAALESVLPRLRVATTKAAPGEEVRVDGALVPPSDDARPLDPGSHTVVATAPGRTPFTRAVTARAGETIEVTIPELVDPNPPRAMEAPRSSSGRTVAVGLAGVGLAGVVVGSIAGAMALSQRSDAERDCAKDVYQFRCPTQAGTDAWNGAQTAGNVSTVGFVAAGVALAGAAVLWVLSPSPRARVGATATGLRLEGTF